MGRVRNGDGALRVAVLGCGPAGSALAILLARRGADVTLFDNGRRPEILVGESLVPAVNPILARLGIEQDTASMGRLKPGVSFSWSAVDRFAFSFARFAPTVPPYAYNIPRPQFEELLVAKAVAAGVHRVVAPAQLERAGNGDGAELLLTADTVAAAPSLRGRQPDLIVDATGRARRAASALHIPARFGPRDDIAHFAHFEGFEWGDEPQGQVLIARLQHGWSWRIPLKNRLSVGIVLGREDASRLGRTPEQRLARAIADDLWLSQSAGRATRVTSVASYSNYQAISTRAHGPGWVAVGDSFGFVDPMLSPGVFLALRSAEMVADALTRFVERPASSTPAELCSALDAYAATHAEMLAAWLELVEYFYDGRMLALLRAGHDWVRERSNFLTCAMQRHIERHVALQASGMGTNARYSRGLLRWLGRHGLRGVEPSDFAIR